MTAADIPFTRPCLTGKELTYIAEAVRSGRLAGNGPFTKRCQRFFQEHYGFHQALLTSSGTDALEMSALLADISPGDEVIMPSYTFVSTANAFVLRGARIRFADSRPDHPNLDVESLEALITPRTKAIVPVHYGGAACDMDALTHLAHQHHLMIIEDAAQAVNAFYRDRAGRLRPLGGIGELAAFSFHETKNVVAGEGGMLIVNRTELTARAEIIWEKGTNRTAFWRGEVDKYEWIDVGSSFLPSEIVAAFLWAQLEGMDAIQQRRMRWWQAYHDRLAPLEEKGWLRRPMLPDYAVHNAHLYYILTEDAATRARLIQHLRARGIYAVFHYLSLHRSPFYREKHDGRPLPNADRYSDTLLRLPLFCDLTEEEIDRVVDALETFFTG